jgi:predicted transcriptional regulator
MRKAKSAMKTVTFAVDKNLFKKLERFSDRVLLSRGMILNSAIDNFLKMNDNERKRVIKKYVKDNKK